MKGTPKDMLNEVEKLLVTDEEFLDAAEAVCTELNLNPTESEHCELALLIQAWVVKFNLKPVDL